MKGYRGSQKDISVNLALLNVFVGETPGWWHLYKDREDGNTWNAFRIAGPLWGESTGVADGLTTQSGSIAEHWFFFVVSLIKHLYKQSGSRWHETPKRYSYLLSRDAPQKLGCDVCNCCGFRVIQLSGTVALHLQPDPGALRGRRDRKRPTSDLAGHDFAII